MRTCYLSLVLLASLLPVVAGRETRLPCSYHSIQYLKAEFHRLCYGPNTVNAVVCSDLTKKLTFCGVPCKHSNYHY